MGGRGRYWRTLRTFTAFPGYRSVIVVIRAVRLDPMLPCTCLSVSDLISLVGNCCAACTPVASLSHTLVVCGRLNGMAPQAWQRASRPGLLKHLYSVFPYCGICSLW